MGDSRYTGQIPKKTFHNYSVGQRKFEGVGLNKMKIRILNILLFF